MIRQSIRYNRRFPLFNHVIHLLRVALTRGNGYGYAYFHQKFIVESIR